MVQVGVEGDDVGVRRADGVDQLHGDGAVVVDPPLALLPCRQPRRQAHEPVEAVEVGQAPVRGRVPVHRHPVDLRGAGVQLVGPGVGVEGAGRVDLGLPVGPGAQVLGQLARRRLRAAHDLGAVARRHERHLRAHGVTTPATASTMRAAAASPGELGRAPAARAGQRGAQALVRADPMQGGSHVRGVGGGQHQGGVGHRLGDRAGAPGDHGDTRHHRLHQRHAEPLVGREGEVDVGGARSTRRAHASDTSPVSRTAVDNPRSPTNDCSALLYS